MLKKIKKIFYNVTLTKRIRYSYYLILIPMMIFTVICVSSLIMGIRTSDDMVNSAAVASDFSLEFKDDFDYEAYLLIVGNKTLQESKLEELLYDATQIVDELEKLGGSKENIERLKSIRKYLDNLRIYINRIEENLGETDNYEKNIEIWKNDVQIVTGLVQENMSEYIYYEIRDIQRSKEAEAHMYKNILKISIIAFLASAIVIIIFSYMIPNSITKPVYELCDVTNQIANGDLTVRSNVDAGAEIGALSDSLNVMVDKINELLVQMKEEQIRLRKAELELLQSQINPHFLYNTLGTIMWLAEGGDRKTVVSMVGSLSDFFRASLNQGKEIVTIKEELNHVRSYLEIQQVRYMDIMEYEIDIPESVHEYLIPKITIQPLVENSLYHGIKNKRGKGKIIITASEDKDNAYITVSDNGIGMKEERLAQVIKAIKDKEAAENQIYGVYNVNERIALKFGDEYGISIESEYGVGTRVQIKLPKTKLE